MPDKRFFLVPLMLSSLLLPVILRKPFFTTPVMASPGVIRVPEDYLTIQEAVYAASFGDTIMVGAGTYYENLNVNQSVLLLGENRSTTIIDGKGVDNVVVLNNTTITVSGFTIRNSEHFFGIQADGFGGHTITDNIISNNAYGIQLFQSGGNTVVDNTLLNNSIIGIEVVYANANNITNNLISQSAYGIKLERSNSSSIVGNTVTDTSYSIYTSYSNGNDIENNNISGKTVGIYMVYSDDSNVSNNTVYEGAYGIELYGGKRNSILNNTVSDNSYGTLLVYSDNNTIDANRALNNDWGIQLYDSDSNTIVHNTISYNTYGIYFTTYSSGNSIYHNNLLYNVMQAYQEPTGVNNWDNGLDEGNYWSDYTGVDDGSLDPRTGEPRVAGDGVGDTNLPHAAIDWYPLMYPWGFVYIHDIAILSVELSSTEVFLGEIVNITVLVTNEGNATETFNITTYYNITATEWAAIETQDVTNLAPSANRTLTFYWNTINITQGVYQIKAEASIVSGETDTTDNVYIDGTVTVTAFAHDIAIINVTLFDTQAYAAEIINITVVAENQGTQSETFNVTVKYENITLSISGTVGTVNFINLAPNTNITLVFEWNTTAIQPCVNYTIIAEATIAPDEFDTSDNIFVDGTVKVKMLGDINGDGVVDIEDLGTVALAFGTKPGDLYWNPEADLNGDNLIDLDDLIIVALRYGDTC